VSDETLLDMLSLFDSERGKTYALLRFYMAGIRFDYD
jgi:hypothetical protein